MTDKTQYAIFNKNETVSQSLYKDMVTELWWLFVYI